MTYSPAQRFFYLFSKKSNDIVDDEIESFIEDLKRNNQNLNGTASFDRNILTLLVEKGWKNLFNYVLQSGVDIDVDEFNSAQILGSALHRAAKMNRREFVCSLLSAGADANIRDYKGCTPLHYASMCHGGFDVVDLLLHRGALVNACGVDDVQPLHWAFDHQTIQRLLDANADVNAKTADGRNALMHLTEALAFVDQPEVLVDAHKSIIALINGGIDLSALNQVDVNAFEQYLSGTMLLRGTKPRWQAYERDIFLKAIAVFVAHNFPLQTMRERRFAATQTIWCDAIRRRVPLDIAYVMLVAGLPLNKTDVAIVASCRTEAPNAVLLLQAIVYCRPHALDWIEDSKLREHVSSNRLESSQEQLLDALKLKWIDSIWQQCVRRVTDLAMIFVALPALIVVEMCLFDQPCLQTIPEQNVWKTVESVRKVVRNKRK